MNAQRTIGLVSGAGSLAFGVQVMNGDRFVSMFVDPGGRQRGELLTFDRDGAPQLAAVFAAVLAQADAVTAAQGSVDEWSVEIGGAVSSTSEARATISIGGSREDARLVVSALDATSRRALSVVALAVEDANACKVHIEAAIRDAAAAGGLCVGPRAKATARERGRQNRTAIMLGILAALIALLFAWCRSNF